MDMSELETKKNEIELERSRWRGRRKMAWLSLYSMIAITAYASTFMPLDRIGKLENIMDWFFLAMSGVIGAYMGFTTWASRK
jgi:hypothetical protein